MLSNLVFVTRAEVTEVVESGMAKMHDKIKFKVVEIVVETFEDATQTIYYDQAS